MPRSIPRRYFSGQGKLKKIFQYFFMPAVLKILQTEHPAHVQPYFNED
jgi:hypothetical protein